MRPAATQRTTADTANLASQMALRETGFEAVQAKVPLSRSATIRLITAKMAATAKIWLETTPTRFIVGSTIGSCTPCEGSAGRILAWSQLFSAARIMNAAVTR